jgi:hypothetical protein
MNDPPLAELIFKGRLDEVRQPGDWAFRFMAGAEKQIIIACPFCGTVAWTEQHRVTQDFPLTLEPSLICARHGCHYRIKDGQVEKIL